MNFKTADLCDEFGSLVQAAAPLFGDYGGVTSFCGQIATVKGFEDNMLLREILEKDRRQQVLVVDGGASTRCALVGDRLAQGGSGNGWVGNVVKGGICGS